MDYIKKAIRKDLKKSIKDNLKLQVWDNLKITLKIPNKVYTLLGVSTI